MENKESFASPKEEKEIVWKGVYVGEEFPDYYGKEIEIKDDNSDPKFPCYQIRFVGEDNWHDNMDDNDFEVLEEAPASKEKPDFEKMVRDVFTGRGMRLEESYVLVGTAFAESIWNDHVEPRDKQIAALQEKYDRMCKAFLLQASKSGKLMGENGELKGDIDTLQEEIRQLKKSEKQLLVEYTRFLRQMNYFNKSPKNIMAGYVGEFQQCQLKNKQ